MDDKMMIPPILSILRDRGYPIYTEGDYNINLIGIRANSRDSNKFDDTFVAVYKHSGLWRSEFFPGTMDPGKFYLDSAERQLNPKGTAIVKFGHYPGLWKVGLHKGYKALQQVGEIEVHRDNNQDGVVDFVRSERGLFGINMHASDTRPWKRDRSLVNGVVGAWSAGCQVHASNIGFRRCVELVEIQNELHPSWSGTVSYTAISAI